MEAAQVLTHTIALKFTTQVERWRVNGCCVGAISLGIFAEGTAPVKASLQCLQRALRNELQDNSWYFLDFSSLLLLFRAIFNKVSSKKSANRQLIWKNSQSICNETTCKPGRVSVHYGKSSFDVAKIVPAPTQTKRKHFLFVNETPCEKGGEIARLQALFDDVCSFVYLSSCSFVYPF